MILKYPVRTEKSIRMLELENMITFVVDSRANKQEIQKELEKEFKVKVIGVRTLMKGNKKTAYIRLAKENVAADIATKLGMM